MLKSVPFLTTSTLLATLTSTTANAEIDFYGIYDLSLQKNVERSVESDVYFKSNGSRTGVFANFDIADGYEWIIQLESAVDFDTSIDGEKNFSHRNSFMGIRGDWGRVIIGQNDTPLKLSQGNIDLFTDTDFQIYQLHHGDIRVADTLIVNYNATERFSINYGVVDNPTGEVNEVGHSLALQYKMDNSYFALAFDKGLVSTDIVRFVAETTLNNFKYGLMLQRAKVRDEETNFGYLASVQYAFPNFLLKAQYSHSDDKIEGGRSFTFGGEWLVTDRVAIYTLLSELSGDDIERDKVLSLGFKYRH